MNSVLPTSCLDIDWDRFGRDIVTFYIHNYGYRKYAKKARSASQAAYVTSQEDNKPESNHAETCKPGIESDRRLNEGTIHPQRDKADTYQCSKPTHNENRAAEDLLTLQSLTVSELANQKSCSGTSEERTLGSVDITSESQNKKFSTSCTV